MKLLKEISDLLLFIFVFFIDVLKNIIIKFMSCFSFNLVLLLLSFFDNSFESLLLRLKILSIT